MGLGYSDRIGCKSLSSSAELLIVLNRNNNNNCLIDIKHLIYKYIQRLMTLVIFLNGFWCSSLAVRLSPIDTRKAI